MCVLERIEQRRYGLDSDITVYTPRPSTQTLPGTRHTKHVGLKKHAVERASLRHEMSIDGGADASSSTTKSSSSEAERKDHDRHAHEGEHGSSSRPSTPPALSQFDPQDEDERDDASVRKWLDFLKSCARGIPPYDQTPSRPPLPRNLVRKVREIVISDEEQFEDELDADEDQKDGSEGRGSGDGTAPPDFRWQDLDLDLARRIRDFYCDQGYLPSPRTSEENMREQILVEYDLHSDTQIKNFQASIDLVSAFFPGTLCAFSLFRDQREHHYALSGPKEIKSAFKRARFPAGQILSGHFQDDQLFLADLQQDWRFLHHPLRRLGIKSFLGRTVKLELDMDPISGSEEERKVSLGIGTLNVYFVENKVDELSETQSTVMQRVTDMLQTQLRATWEGHRRSREAKANTAISGFIDDALASHDPTRLASSEDQQKQKDNFVHLDNLKKEKEATTNSDDPAGPLQEEPGKLEKMAWSACKRLADVLQQIDGLCIVDLRSVQPVVCVFERLEAG